MGGEDAIFFVLVDGEEISLNPMFKTNNAAEERTLEIPFSEGTKEIEIIGTLLVPEFGTITMLILTIAIVSIIAITARSGIIKKV